MYEYIPAFTRFNKTITLAFIEPLHSTFRHALNLSYTLIVPLVRHFRAPSEWPHAAGRPTSEFT
jgi:hypothetical protein